METYRYRARAADGTRVNGVMEAFDEFEAVARIKEDYPIVEKISQIKSGQRERIDINEPLWVSDKVLSLVANQFSILLRAGLSMTRVVELIAEQTSDRLMKRILTESAADVGAGFSLAQSLEKNGKKIPATFIQTVRAGEESGNLESCFDRLKIYYEKSEKVKKKVKSAMSYPIFLLGLAVVVIIIVMIKLVPSMMGMYDTTGSDLPLPTKILIGMSDFFQNWWVVVVVVMAGIVLAYKLYAKSESGSMNLAKLKMKIPIIKNITRMNAASQFANTMCTLLSAGLPMTRVLDITSKVVDNKAVGETLGEAVLGLEEGRSLGDMLHGNPYLPAMLVEMVNVGESSGMLEETMDTIGTYYDQEAEEASNKALSMLEPMITVIMGLVIGFVLIAIYIPMFTMTTTVG